MAQESNNTVWLDQAYENTLPKSRIDTHLSLCKIDPYLLTFRDTNQCIDYITDLNENDTKIILVISLVVASDDSLIQLCEELLQVASIYILYNSNEEISMHCKTSVKVHGCFSDRQLLFDQLYRIPGIRRYRREGFVRDDFLFNTLTNTAPSSSPFTITLASDNSSNINSKRQEPEFMYSSIVRDILLNIDATKQELIDFCRQKYAGNKTALNVIDEFQNYYDASNAILWYTRETFLCRLLNKALRTQRIDTLYSLRYFIKDLHIQLKERHSQQILGGDFKDQSVRTVYRGQRMETWEFNKKILNNEGGFFSVSTFFSTTVHEYVARVYAGDESEEDSDWHQHVLFQIGIDKTTNKVPFADITTESAFQVGESEVLFTMGVIFRIHSISKEHQGTWIVQLNMIDEEDEKLKELSQYMSEDAVNDIPLAKLAKLVSYLAKYDKAEKYYLLSLQDPKMTNNFPSLVKVHNQLGLTYKNQGQPQKAVEEYKEALKICLTYLPSIDCLLIDTYNNLGSIYAQLHDYVQALSYCTKALVTAMKDPKSNENQVATVHNTIGMIYSAQCNYSQALNSYEKCLRITYRILPSNHPLLATIYINIASIYQVQNDHNVAETFYNKALHIQLTSLPVNHPSLVTTYMNLGQNLYDQGRVKDALVYMHKAMDTCAYTKQENHAAARFAVDRKESATATQSQKDEDDIRLFNVIMKNLKENFTGMVHEDGGTIKLNLEKGFYLALEPI